MSSDENEDESQFKSNLAEQKSIYKLIRKVESRPFLFNCRDRNHNRRDVTADAWNEVAKGLKIKGKNVTGAECKRKWRVLRTYYLKKKRALEEKGDVGASDKVPWEYFRIMDRVLSPYTDESENTPSSYPEDESIEDQNQEDPEDIDNDNQNSENNITFATKSTPTTSSTRGGKRKTDVTDKSIQEKISKASKECKMEKDQFYHFGMFIGSKLKSAPPQIADHLMSRICRMLFETMYSIVDLGDGTSHDFAAETTDTTDP